VTTGDRCGHRDRGDTQSLGDALIREEDLDLQRSLSQDDDPSSNLLAFDFSLNFRRGVCHLKSFLFQQTFVYWND
jgi:hypothetical protein